MNCSYQLRKEIPGRWYNIACLVLSNWSHANHGKCFLPLLSKCSALLFPVFFVMLSGAQVFSSFCCLWFLFSTFSLFPTVTIRWSLPFSEKSIQRTLLNSMLNCQNSSVNNNFEANMDLQHGRSDKVVSRSPHSTEIKWL